MFNCLCALGQIQHTQEQGGTKYFVSAKLCFLEKVNKKTAMLENKL